MASNDAVFQRRNKQIQDAIDGQNLKQALNLVEKRMKKGEDTVFLRAWKAHILSRHVDETHHQRGIAETLDLCKREPPTTDLDTIDILHQTLQKEGRHEDTMRGVWEKAAKAKPQDHELQIRWFSHSFDNDDWKSAQKAAMSLQANFPKERNYYFWAILLGHLISVDNRSSDSDRTLFGTLAYRMISKAADSVPSDPKELLSVSRAIQTPEELFLLIKIFQSSKRHTEIVKILNSENVGINSRIVQNEWSFVGMKLASLGEAGMWTEGLSYAKSLLDVPEDESGQRALQERDDWAVWNIIVGAAKNIKDPARTAEIQDFVQKFIDFRPNSRNAHLAHLDLIYSRFEAGSLKVDDLLAACQKYFDRSKTKLYCCEDLARCLPALDKASLAKFVEHALKSQTDTNEEGLARSVSKLAINNPSRGVAMINALKLEYCFQLSSDDSHVTRQRVENFVSRCLQHYRETDRPERNPEESESSTIESQPTDDLCLLAATCLIRFNELWADGSRQSIRDIALIRAASILEHLLRDSPHNYQARLLLVRIYLLLGAGSLALKTFSQLSVKQLQFETVAHNLFTRLATIHPHSAPPIEGAEYKDFDPQSAFVQALHFYRNAEITTLRHRSNGLEYGSYINVEGTIGLQKRLRHSICRKMWALEVRRMQRLVGGDPMGRYDELVKDESPLVDQRDFDAFMNCEPPGKPRFEELMRLGPLPNGRWVVSARVTDRIFSLLRSISLQKPDSTEFDMPSPEEVSGPESESGMTPAEVEVATINLCLLKVVSFMSGLKSVTSEDVDRCLAQVEEWLCAKLKRLLFDSNSVSPTSSNAAICLRLETPSAPSWRYLHEMFTTLESLKATSMITSLASKKGTKTVKLPKDRVDRLASLTPQVHESIRANTRTLKSRLAESGVLGDLIELVLNGPGKDEEGKNLRVDLEKTLDLPALELFCGSLMESWGEGLDGVLEVSI